MFIDIHAHCYWQRVPFSNSWANPEELIEIYDALDIERGCLLPVVSPEVYFPQSNEDILNMAAKYPDRFIPFCNVDPRAMANSPKAQLERPLQYYKDMGCKGVGEVMPGLEVMDDRVQNLFACAEKVGLPVTIELAHTKTNIFGMYDDPGLPGLEITLQRHPELVIFGHGPVFWSELSILGTPAERGVAFRLTGGQCGRLPGGPLLGEGVVPKLFRRYPNLMGDLSDGTPLNMFMRDEEYAAKFINEFQDRLFFGTDYCCMAIGTNIGMVPFLKKLRDTGKISEEVFNKVARENAIRLLNL